MDMEKMCLGLGLSKRSEGQINFKGNRIQQSTHTWTEFWQINQMAVKTDNLTFLCKRESCLVLKPDIFRLNKKCVKHSAIIKQG